MGWLVLFLLVGSVGHDPWQWPETHVFGVIHHYLTHNSWLIPTNVSTPFMEKTPLYYWTGVVFCHLFGALLPLHDAARLATPFYILLTIGFTWKTSQVLFADRPEKSTLGWISIALLLGQIGIISEAHILQTDISLLAGTVITFYGMALLGCQPGRWKAAGGWIGLGIGVAFMSKGFFVPFTLALSGLLLLVALPELRRRTTWQALALALLVASPFLTVWPALVYRDSPALFMQWFWDNNVGRFLGFTVDQLGRSNRSFYVESRLLSFAFPAWPFAAWRIVRNPLRQWNEKDFILPLMVFFTGVVILDVSATAGGNYLMPFLPCLAWMAAPMVIRLPRWFLQHGTAVLRTLFTVGALGVWLAWIDLRLAPEARFFPKLLAKMGKWVPLDFVPPDQPVAIAVALLTLALWLYSFRLYAPTALRIAYTWFIGVTLIWVTMMTLLLPWRNAVKSFSVPLMDMVEFIRRMPTPPDCIQTPYYIEDISPMYEYVAKPLLHVKDGDADCPLVFVPNMYEVPPSISIKWEPIWAGRRPAERQKQQLGLYGPHAAAQ